MANKKAKIRFEEDLPSSYSTSSALLENQGILDLKFPALIIGHFLWFLRIFCESFQVKKK